jgi:phosphatidylserine decarboxylase
LRVDRAGFPFIIGALALAAAAAIWLSWIVAAPLVALAAFFTFFFRDPDRLIPSTLRDADVLAPADGRVLVAGDMIAEGAPPGTWKQFSIFLSPMDLHVNRVPASGRVTLTPGQFLPVSPRRGGKKGRSDLDRSQASRSSRGRSSACSRAALSAGWRAATRCARGSTSGS